MTYSFNRQHDRGKDAERFIYELFQPAFNVIPAERYLQDAGVDFLFTDRTTNKTWQVELKTDSRAARSGNAFIETVSVKRPGEEIRGWAYTSEADWLLYFLPQLPRIYRLSFEELRVELPAWVSRYPVRSIPNKTWETIGLLVPLSELYRVSNEVIEW